MRSLDDRNDDMLAQAHPIFARAVTQILSDLQDNGWQPRIAELRRTEAQQAEKVKTHRSKTMKSWHVPSTQGLLRSGRHSIEIVNGNAADIVDNRYGWGGQASKLDFKFWQDLGAAAKKFGCSWGGDWKTFKDVAHVEMRIVESPARDTVPV